mmetsp:Transcript_152554/g.370282  ORF Transcript_152554/g.370282 Transcript_152554/m.370282 type:complete len:100 (-) Transcript_152554:119-418(-)
MSRGTTWWKSRGVGSPTDEGGVSVCDPLSRQGFRGEVWVAASLGVAGSTCDGDRNNDPPERGCGMGRGNGWGVCHWEGELGSVASLLRWRRSGGNIPAG